MNDADALAREPHCLADFALTREMSAHQEGLFAVRHALACRHCAGDRFDPIEVRSAKFGGCGIEARCGRCGQTGTVFRASRDGYDGRLGHAGFLEQVDDRQPLATAEGKPVQGVLVAAELTYSIDPRELASIAAEESLATQDLFDWFHLCVRSGGHEEWRSIWDYECA
jgi:hypothetical protein